MKIIDSAIVPIMILIGSLFTLGCSHSPEASISDGISGTITEAGSTTIQPLAERLAGAFTNNHPNVFITIQGGGSSVGVNSAANGTVDIGAASRDLKPGEPDLFKHLICREGIAVVTNPTNSVDDLSVAEIRQIFAGVFTSWREVGGADQDIIPVAREEGSGTRAAFEEMVMEDELITSSAILQPSNGSVRNTVAMTPNSIGFISFGYVDDSVKSLAVNGVDGSIDNAKTGRYPIVRPLYFLTDDEPTGLVERFIGFCLGSEGQAIVVDEGYIPLK